jgi:hypothetical protein
MIAMTHFLQRLMAGVGEPASSAAKPLSQIGNIRNRFDNQTPKEV